MNELTKNTILNRGQYRIVKVIGRGGFGITYLAEQIGYYRSTGFGEEFMTLSNSEEVVIKELFYSDYCTRDTKTGLISISDTDKKREFQKLVKNQLDEGWIIRGLNHPHIIKTRDIFEENETAYMVMDYIESTDLEDMVKDGKRLLIPRALKYIYETLDAVEYFHTQAEKRILHLDISPSNILVNKKDQAILIDFGAALTYDGMNNSIASRTSQIITGRKRYYSPNEQSDIDLLKSFDATFDTYAVGATLYHLLSGAIPQLSNMISSGREKFIPPSHKAKDAGISQYLDAVVAKAMAPKYRDRYFSAKELWEDLKKDDAYKESIKNIRDAMNRNDFSEVKKLLGKHKTDFLSTEEFTVLESEAKRKIKEAEKRQKSETALKEIEEKIKTGDLRSAKILIAKYKTDYGTSTHLEILDRKVQSIEESQKTILQIKEKIKEEDLSSAKKLIVQYKKDFSDNDKIVALEKEIEKVEGSKTQLLEPKKTKDSDKKETKKEVTELIDPNKLKSGQQSKRKTGEGVTELIDTQKPKPVPKQQSQLKSTPQPNPYSVTKKSNTKTYLIMGTVILLPLIGYFGYQVINNDSKQSVAAEILLNQPEVFEENGLFGYKTGEEILLPAEFSAAGDFAENIAEAVRNDSVFTVDSTGKVTFAEIPSQDEGSIFPTSEPEPEIVIKEEEKSKVDPAQKAEEERKAKEKQEQGDWNKAIAGNTISSYRNYLNKYPNGKFVSDAHNLIEKKAMDDEFEKLLKEYSDELYNTAKELVDRAGLAKCRNTPSCKKGALEFLNEALDFNPDNSKAKSLKEQLLR